MNITATHEVSFIGLAADIVGAYITKNNVTTSELPGLIAPVHASLTSLDKPASVPEENHKVTAAQTWKSVRPGAITSFMHGKPYKSLKRHLTVRGISPDEYRKKFGLPHDYPMITATYAATALN